MKDFLYSFYWRKCSYVYVFGTWNRFTVLGLLGNLDASQGSEWEEAMLSCLPEVVENPFVLDLAELIPPPNNEVKCRNSLLTTAVSRGATAEIAILSGPCSRMMAPAAYLMEVRLMCVVTTAFC